MSWSTKSPRDKPVCEYLVGIVDEVRERESSRAKCELIGNLSSLAFLSWRQQTSLPPPPPLPAALAQGFVLQPLLLHHLLHHLLTLLHRGHPDKPDDHSLCTSLCMCPKYKVTLPPTNDWINPNKSISHPHNCPEELRMPPTSWCKVSCLSYSDGLLAGVHTGTPSNAPGTSGVSALHSASKGTCHAAAPPPPLAPPRLPESKSPMLI